MPLTDTFIDVVTVPRRHAADTTAELKPGLYVPRHARPEDTTIRASVPMSATVAARSSSRRGRLYSVRSLLGLR